MSAYIYTIHGVYVGSTKKWNNRLERHNSGFTNLKDLDYNKKLYQYLRENGLGIEMKVIDTCPIDEQYIREQEWMDKLQYKYNDIRAYRSPEYIKERRKQYYIDNIEKITSKMKQYRIDNKEKIKERKRIKFTCECGGICSRNDMARHRKTKKHLLFINKTN